MILRVMWDGGADRQRDKGMRILMGETVYQYLCGVLRSRGKTMYPWKVIQGDTPITLTDPWLRRRDLRRTSNAASESALNRPKV